MAEVGLSVMNALSTLRIAGMYEVPEVPLNIVHIAVLVGSPMEAVVDVHLAPTSVDAYRNHPPPSPVERLHPGTPFVG